MANEINNTDVKLVTNCDRLQSLKHSSVKLLKQTMGKSVTSLVTDVKAVLSWKFLYFCIA